jgi:hypothetical protein
MIAMHDTGSVLYRRRRVMLAVLVAGAVLVALCLTVARLMAALAPALHAMG